MGYSAGANLIYGIPLSQEDYDNIILSVDPENKYDGDYWAINNKILEPKYGIKIISYGNYSYECEYVLGIAESNRDGFDWLTAIEPVEIKSE